MVLTRSEKEQLVSDLTENLKEKKGLAVFAFQSLTVADSAKIRRELKGNKGAMHVVKKRLYKRIAEHLGLPDMGRVEGSIAITWSDDEIVPAKVSNTFVKDHEGSTLVGGRLNGNPLGAADVKALASLPGQHELRGQLVSVLSGPLRGFARVLSGTLRGLPGVLHAISQKQG